MGRSIFISKIPPTLSIAIIYELLSEYTPRQGYIRGSYGFIKVNNHEEVIKKYSKIWLHEGPITMEIATGKRKGKKNNGHKKQRKRRKRSYKKKDKKKGDTTERNSTTKATALHPDQIDKQEGGVHKHTNKQGTEEVNNTNKEPIKRKIQNMKNPLQKPLIIQGENQKTKNSIRHIANEIAETWTRETPHFKIKDK
ncbi:hypothetical protein M0811_02856 [Anaeramoeba ignava]|uniref:RRM domain-containing protein n=1 Tax=Anaeramoeba ignava TaxID=1746090 RepID=A0A9Q0L7T3_ANAIG|nr:hypothetical protein M0811_02856 [Anaeramoeba ignava]